MTAGRGGDTLVADKIARDAGFSPEEVRAAAEAVFDYEQRRRPNPAVRGVTAKHIEVAVYALVAAREARGEPARRSHARATDRQRRARFSEAARVAGKAKAVA